MTLRSILALVSLLAISCTAQPGGPLKVGDAAPQVSGTTEAGATLALAEVYAQQAYTLVYFYPKAGTSGCTAQGCSLRDAHEGLVGKGVAVIGVSSDSVAAQKAFKDTNHFPFPLIADTDRKVQEAFAVPTYPGTKDAQRQAFLIKGGKVVWLDFTASTRQQAADVLKFVNAQ